MKYLKINSTLIIINPEKQLEGEKQKLNILNNNYQKGLNDELSDFRRLSRKILQTEIK